MKLNNKNASDLLQKDKIKSNNAAKNIINNKDLDAWKCLVENSEYIFDFIKDAACEKLLNACTKDNINNLFDFMQYYDMGFDDFIAAAFEKFQNEEINKKFLSLLKDASESEKCYAAKYFCYVQNQNAQKLLFENSKSTNDALSQNCALALASMKDMEAFEFYKNQLKSDDDWQKVQAVQFLSFYQDKNILPDMFRAMKNSSMKEHMAGEIALSTDISEYFNSPDSELKELSLECFDYIISSLSEIWPLSTIIDFKISKCLNIIFDLSKKQNDPFKGKYSEILLKSRSMFNLFNEFDEYKFDEDKKTLQELTKICSFLNSLSNDFWEAQIDDLLDELTSENKARKSSAINLISYLELNIASQYLLEVLDSEENEQMICEIVMALSKLNCIPQIKNKKEITEKIKHNENIKAIVESLFANHY